MNKIIRNGVFEMMEIDWIDDAKRTGRFLEFSTQEQNEYMDFLFNL